MKPFDAEISKSVATSPGRRGPPPVKTTNAPSTKANLADVMRAAVPWYLPHGWCPTETGKNCSRKRRRPRRDLRECRLPMGRKEGQRRMVRNDRYLARRTFRGGMARARGTDDQAEVALVRGGFGGRGGRRGSGVCSRP